MLSRIFSAGLHGTEGFIVCVETDVGEGLPGVNMIGTLSSEVRESQDRVRTAIHNCGLTYEPQRITVNLSPADTRKEGCGYDLPIAIGFLVSYGLIPHKSNKYIFNDSVFVGELSLSGELLGVHGIISLACAARDAGFKRIIVPEENAIEGSVIEGIDCIGVRNLRQIINILNGREELPDKTVYSELDYPFVYQKDFSEVYGQETVKRATVLAVAGRHNILYIGPAGTGKSMIASRIPGIMPTMNLEERINVSKLYSVCGLLPKNEPLLRNRPFRSPHHTISPQALSGGGTWPKPGEISLATSGVLFLDELAEFKAQTIESLRQPMEDKKVLISRVNSSIEYPADFVLCAATNPCKCGFYPDRNKCNCTDAQIRSYLGKISKPILDRIDICVETTIPTYSELSAEKDKGQTSEQIREKVEYVRAIQHERFANDIISFNSEMTPDMIEEYCRLSEKDEEFLKEVYVKKNMSARGLHKILKVARTIADYNERKNIAHDDLCEAICYRILEDKYWKGGRHIEPDYVSRQVRR